MSEALQPLTHDDLKTGSTKVDFERLMQEALTMPGQMGSTYNRFYEYSYGNQIALWMQRVEGPVATYQRWQDVGRHVKKGAKAASILRPIMRKVENDQGELSMQVRGFKWVRCIFGFNDTEGEDLPPWDPPEWNTDRALGALGITRVAFDSLSGNAQGYSHGKEIAINPVAVYPFKTLWHELGHIGLGHTSGQGLKEYREHRGLMEFQAESTAYLGMNELGATDQFNAGESRAYIQSWLAGREPTEKHIREVFSTVDKLLKAGRAADE